jgi:hypothetical protein
MDDESRTEMVAQFMGITGLSDETTCRGLLEAFGWNVDGAATAYFDDPSGFAPPPPSALPPSAHAAPMMFRPPERLVDPLPMYDDEDEDEDEDEDFEYRPPPRQPQQPAYSDLANDDDGDDPMRSALFPGRRTGRSGGFELPRASYMPQAGGVLNDNDHLQRILTESAQLAHQAARQAGDALHAGAEGGADGDDFKSALARSQAVRGGARTRARRPRRPATLRRERARSDLSARPHLLSRSRAARAALASSARSALCARRRSRRRRSGCSRARWR